MNKLKESPVDQQKCEHLSLFYCPSFYEFDDTMLYWCEDCGKGWYK